MIDTHAHLASSDYDADRDAVIARAWEAGLTSIVIIGAGAGLEGNHKALALAETDKRFRAVVGIHPHDAGKVEGDWLSEIERIAKHPRAVAIGEIGLDYHYSEPSHEQQQEVFRKQVMLAEKIGKPIVIHDREAHDDLWNILQEVGVPKRGGIFHCFSADLPFAKRAIEAGFYISIPGIITFKKAGFLPEVVRELPLERLVIETDAPYLAPMPHRGGRNEPAFVRAVAEKISEIRGVAIDHVIAATTQNAMRIFDFDPAQESATS